MEATHSEGNWTASSNYSSSFLVYEQVSYPLSYQIIATILHILIFIFGVVGNCVVILVITRSKSLHSPAYTYIVSLAVADLIVLISTVPEAILGHYIGNQWLFGQVGCSVFIFSNFLGINGGSLSILAFTVEQHVAVCGSAPGVGRFWKRTRLIIGALWVFTIAYCSPWLFALTEVKPDPNDASKSQCTMSLSRQLYLGLFGTDLILFYLIPLVVALVCYGQIAITLNRLSGAGWRTPNRNSVDLPQGPQVGLSPNSENLLNAGRQSSRSTTTRLRITDSTMFEGRFTDHIKPQSQKQVVFLHITTGCLNENLHDNFSLRFFEC
ncbi:hypothetical protein RvY_12216-1 [Ramazzottius varieornatus]|uniref:Thyrotropin-releasing hormone receptor n=1 Tax=Ramazzottius varieornatus TaxID=947166 RepID=A0A1D1VIP8_RAMVA|nr:hypothetical protein RvY_12216-1 [Ramazzottius varieornatus]